MPVTITVDQIGKPAGTAGTAREDLTTGTGILLTANGGPFIQYQWRIIHKPINILVPRRSGALLATPGASTTILQPIDIEGTHLVEVTVNSGTGLGARPEDIARISFYAGAPLAVDPRQLPRRRPAAFESTEHNVGDVLDPLGNPDGWSREWYRWFATLEAVVPGKSWASARVYLPNGGPAAIVRQYNVATVTQIATGVLEVVFTEPMPDDQYSVIVTVIDDNGFAAGTQFTTTGFFIGMSDKTGASKDMSVCFRVELGV